MNHRPIIALAPNGAYKQKSDHVEVPLTTKEVVETSVAAVKAGATMLHLHIRDDNGQHSLNPEIYKRTIDAINNEVGDQLVIQITSEAAGKYSPETQISTVKEVNPACVSIALRELISAKATIKPAQALFYWCAEQACRIQFILYSEQDLLNYFKFVSAEIIPNSPHSVLFVLGRYSNRQESTLNDLRPFLQHEHLLKIPWMVCAFGPSEQSCVISAAKAGGHIRLGFENNLLRRNGAVAQNNIHQLLDLSSALHQHGINAANHTETQKILLIREPTPP